MSVDIRNYAFIDGNYFRLAYIDTMAQFFGPDVISFDFHHLDFAGLRPKLQASKIFFYDSVNEDAPDKDERQAFLDQIGTLDGFHVRRGSFSKSKSPKRAKQKQVDIQLAVDMLTHTHNKNIWHGSLIAGDVDFKPLVDALVNQGLHLHLYYERKSGSKHLIRAADVGQEMTLELLHDWSTDAVKNAHPIPRVHRGHFDEQTQFNSVERRGTWKGMKVEFCSAKSSGKYALVRHANVDSNVRAMVFNDPEMLEKFWELHLGQIQWSDAEAVKPA